jgi:hypothetical protein
MSVPMSDVSGKGWWELRGLGHVLERGLERAGRELRGDVEECLREEMIGMEANPEGAADEEEGNGRRAECLELCKAVRVALGGRSAG